MMLGIFAHGYFAIGSSFFFFFFINTNEGEGNSLKS